MRKRCSRCREVKPSSEFYKNRSTADGLNYYCKSCHVTCNRIYYEKAGYTSPSHKDHYQKFLKTHGVSHAVYYKNGKKNSSKAFKRAKYRCELCGSSEGLSIHHKDRRGRNYLEAGKRVNNALNNLQVLCKRCHGSIHGKQKGKHKTKEQL